MPHKHDPGTYIIYVFSSLGRPKGQTLRPNYTSATALADRWKSLTGGTASVHRCLYNNALLRPAFSEDQQ